MASEAPLVRHVAIVASSIDDETRLRRAIGEVSPNTRVVALGDPASPTVQIDHVITAAWPVDAIRTLLTALATGRPAPPPVVVPPSTPVEARDVQRAVAAARRLATATDLASWEAIATGVLLELLELDRGHCLYHDAVQGALWSEARLGEPAGDDRRATAGLAGFVAHTGIPVLAPRASHDPRFAPAIDDPDGDPDDQLIAQPIHGADGMIHAVLVGARRRQRQPLAAAELALLARLATLIAPSLDQLALHGHAQSILDDGAREVHLFRREAVDAQLQPRWGDVLRISPAWLPWAYRAMGALLAATAVLVAVGEVSTYSAGPAVIRSLARTPVIARTPGNIVAVEAMPGFPIAAGAVIARLDDTDQRKAIAGLERELETHLRNHMVDPSDVVADATVRTLRNQLASARAALDERLIRATTSGRVGDVRVRPGQHVGPGDLVATVVDTRQGLEVIALLPGEDRPRLVPGMVLRLELAGYRYAYQGVAIESVSPDVVSPSEARRVLGTEVADGLALAGPVVLVRGRLPSAEFVIDGRALAYHDGMQGLAEVRVDIEPIAVALVPGLRRFR